MNRAVKLTAAFLSVLLLVCMVASCGQNASGKVTNVRMTVTADDTIILYDVPVAVVGEEPTVMDAFLQAVKDDDGFPPVRYDDDKEPSAVLDIAGFLDTPDKYWEFRVNDRSFTQIRGRANAYSIKEGDRIYFEYGAAAAESGE